ncbi:hypothetical protein OIV57_33795, partial [Burkholderia pseudomallei]|uniref:glycine cleavage T C-terminal barrel domain-containing protein n=1 Tax=Burkholderia pseudomallei TaxID=28450 RepID=UPI0021F6F83C
MGLRTEDAQSVLQEGGKSVERDGAAREDGTKRMLGHGTSSYYSPMLNRSIALAVVKGGLSR